MKLALNGALTVGTLDGANIEIRDHVGEENIFIFGMKADEVLARRKLGLDATESIQASPVLSRVLAALDRGEFSPGERARFAPITHAIRHLDYYMVAADFDDYWKTQRQIDEAWNSPRWTSAAILNVARMGWFSSDRTIREYAEDIWAVPALAETSK
jgi:glycogen phosphorylase